MLLACAQEARNRQHTPASGLAAREKADRKGEISFLPAFSLGIHQAVCLFVEEAVGATVIMPNARADFK